MSDPIKVIFIMGEGRSGSTLLDLVLGNHSEVIGTGELWTLFTQDQSRIGICSCGVEVPRCHFWQKVTKEFLSAAERPTLNEMNMLCNWNDRLEIAALQSILPFNCQIKRYRELNNLIYRKILSVSGKGAVVDSTKRVGRAFNLLKCDSLDMRIIHIVRDGRGVHWSRIRDKLRDEKKGSRRSRSAVLNFTKWTIKNYFAFEIDKRFPDRCVMVKYEELMSNPVKELKRIGRTCGLCIDKLIERIENNKLESVSHQIGGNQRTRNFPGHIQFRADMEWKSNVPPKDRIIFQILSGAVAKRAGYDI